MGSERQLLAAVVDWPTQSVFRGRWPIVTGLNHYLALGSILALDRSLQ